MPELNGVMIVTREYTADAPTGMKFSTLAGVIGGGVVSSGTLSPSLGVGIGLAYLPAASSAPGTRIEIDVRGRVRPAIVRKKPLYSRA